MSFKGSLEAFAIFQSRSENLTGIFWLPDSNVNIRSIKGFKIAWLLQDKQLDSIFILLFVECLLT